MSKSNYMGNKGAQKLITLLVNEIKNSVSDYSSSEELKNAIQKVIDENAEALNFAGDFLTEKGFGHLRYYQDKFEYYDDDRSEWIETSITPENVYLLNMMPQPCDYVFGIYDHEIGHYKIKFKAPKDTVIENQVACVVDKIVIKRKKDEAPKTMDDQNAVLVAELGRQDLYSYENDWFVDDQFTPALNDNWVYKVFPVATVGFANESPSNATDPILCKDHFLFGFDWKFSESNPANAITYPKECDNARFNPAYMDFKNNAFNYGDWASAWFIRDLLPVMLKYDGSIGELLDKNDYAKKIDGSVSSIASENYEGNAMMGIPTVWLKYDYDTESNTMKFRCTDNVSGSIPDKDKYKAYAHTDRNGETIPYVFEYIYDGWEEASSTSGGSGNGRLRSISGKTPTTNTTRDHECEAAKKNNKDNENIWYTLEFADWMLINMLLILISRHLNSQTQFGTGNNNSYVSSSNTGIKQNGTMNDKGLFWGNQDNVTGVKVFGIENWWGNIWKGMAGWILKNGKHFVKLTWKGDECVKSGEEDLEATERTDGYNYDGQGYLELTDVPQPSGTSGGYISQLKSTDYGPIPTVISGSATTYTCDGFWFNNSITAYALVGAGSETIMAGMLQSDLGDLLENYCDTYGSAPDCKPSKETQEKYAETLKTLRAGGEIE